MNNEAADDLDNLTDEDKEACAVCGREGWPSEMPTCDQCGNALCRPCSYEYEDDFGNTECCGVRA